MLRKTRQIQMSLPSIQITVVLSELRVTKTRYTWIRYRSTQEVKEDPGDRQQFLAVVIQVSYNALQNKQNRKKSSNYAPFMLNPHVNMYVFLNNGVDYLRMLIISRILS